MSLHVRLFTNFWTHRKTAKLRSILGNDAFWLPPRLWSYAAENQPDGDFSSYSPEELAMLLGYQGDAQAMLQAMQRACFMVGMKVNDWETHNGYHHEFSERAKKAAKARWDKEKKGYERKGKETSNALSNAPSINEPKKASPFEEISLEWNKKESLPKCLSETLKRVAASKARFSEEFFSKHWRTALDKVAVSKFCLGQTDRGTWKASIDWFLTPDAVPKIMEEKYDDRDKVKKDYAAKPTGCFAQEDSK